MFPHQRFSILSFEGNDLDIWTFKEWLLNTSDFKYILLPVYHEMDIKICFKFLRETDNMTKQELKAALVCSLVWKIKIKNRQILVLDEKRSAWYFSL